MRVAETGERFTAPMHGIDTNDGSYGNRFGSVHKLLTPFASFLALRLDEATFETRGFPAAPADRRERLETIGQAFIKGYNVAVRKSDLEAITAFIADAPHELRGFNAEGAAMAIALKQAFGLGAPLEPFLALTNGRHNYLTHVGIGWAMARVPLRRRSLQRCLDPLLRPLTDDGRGFHDLYFYHKKVLRKAASRTAGYRARAYDQGVGRALWFYAGARPDVAETLVSRFHRGRRNDLWAGLGLAAIYAGGAPVAELVALQTLAGAHRPALAQGAAFAAEAAMRGGTLTQRLDEDCRLLTGKSAAEASALVLDRLAALRSGHDQKEIPLYEAWRLSIQAVFAATLDEKKNRYADLV